MSTHPDGQEGPALALSLPGRAVLLSPAVPAVSEQEEAEQGAWGASVSPSSVVASCLLLLREGLAWHQARCKSGSWICC